MIGGRKTVGTNALFILWFEIQKEKKEKQEAVK